MKSKIVSVDKEVMGGVAVFAGTRVPVAVLFENLRDGLSLEEILDSCPTLKREQATAALQQAELLLEMAEAA